MFNSGLGTIIAFLLAVIVALVGAFVVRESGGSPREAIASSGRAFRWTLGCIAAMLTIYAGIEIVAVLQELP